MRNKVRVEVKDSTKSPSLQTKTRRRAGSPAFSSIKVGASENTDAFVPTDGACILLWGSKQDCTLASVEISAGQLARLERKAADRNISLGSFVHQGFNRLLAELEGRVDVRAKRALAGSIPALAAAKGGAQ